eukprot:gene1363-4538_t
MLGIFNTAGSGRNIYVYDFMVRLSMSSGDPFNGSNEHVFVGTSGDKGNNDVTFMDHREDKIRLFQDIGIALRIRAGSDTDKLVNCSSRIRYARRDVSN